MANSALAVNDICPEVHQTARQFTLNGQSDIPEIPLVIASQKRVPFYTAPDEQCKVNGLYVVAGDVLRAYKHYGDYTWVSYSTVKGESIPGWVRTSALDDYSPLKATVRKNALSDSDFIVVSKERWFGLGSSYSRTFGPLFATEIASSYIGDFPNQAGGLNKFSSHEYSDLTVISSNTNYDARLWGMDDDYIIFALQLKSSAYKTVRGIGVGDSVNALRHAYTGIPSDDSTQVITYVLNDRSLSFSVADGKVTAVDLAYRDRE